MSNNFIIKTRITIVPTEMAEIKLLNNCGKTVVAVVKFLGKNKFEYCVIKVKNYFKKISRRFNADSVARVVPRLQQNYTVILINRFKIRRCQPSDIDYYFFNTPKIISRHINVYEVLFSKKLVYMRYIKLMLTREYSATATM